MAQADPSWTEQDSALYRQLADIAVPDRDEQFAVLLSLLPFARDQRFRVLELGAGEGFLAEALLAAFPNASVTALDGSASMRDAPAARLARFGDRASVELFELAAPGWLPRLDGVDVVWASLSVHHLDHRGKQALFGEVVRRSSDRAVLLLADVVEPVNAVVRALFAELYDHVAETQSLAQTGGRAAYEAFQREQWNCYRHPGPVDIPSPLSAQLSWLREAGFAAADVFWQRAGHAVYGGYKATNPGVEASPRLAFAEALTLVREVLAKPVAKG